MIRQLRGTVVDIEEDAVVLDVQGVGYLIHTTVSTEHFALDTDTKFYTHLAVRENALDLYGFLDRDTLEIFELLITLPKIGPKSAQQILRQADIELLKQSVRNDDAGYLSKMSGIGKKSAEKIVLGLKDKFEAYDEEAFIAPSDSNEPTAYARDTIDALVALGYPQDEARRTVRRITAEQPDITNSADALKASLKILSN